MKPRHLLLAIAAAACVLAACQRPPEPAAESADGDYAVQPWTLFAEPGSMAPDLSLAPGERVLLSWINRREGRRTALQFASFTEAGGWQSQPRTIAVGQSLVASWADTPHVLGTPDGALWAQWLQSNPAGAGAYDTVLARSRDGGMTWTQMTRVNNDQAAAEHGFAALWPRGADGIGIAWLDGREQAGVGGGEHGAAHGGNAGAMQLRANAFDLELQRVADTVVDPRVCDCCQVAVAMTPGGAVLAYRDRGEDEVRDIAVARLRDGAWTAPALVHADGWRIDACPVNGPAIAARDSEVVVGWYTEVDGVPTVRLARSGDGGGSFAAPVDVEAGDPVQGRVAVAVDARQAWIAWLRQDADGQRLMLARYAPDLSKRLQQLEVAKLAARGPASGTPRMVADAGGLWLVWTDVAEGASRLQGARIAR